MSPKNATTRQQPNVGAKTHNADQIRMLRALDRSSEWKIIFIAAIPPPQHPIHHTPENFELQDFSWQLICPCTKAPLRSRLNSTLQYRLKGDCSFFSRLETEISHSLTKFGAECWQNVDLHGAQYHIVHKLQYNGRRMCPPPVQFLFLFFLQRVDRAYKDRRRLRRLIEITAATAYNAIQKSRRNPAWVDNDRLQSSICTSSSFSSNLNLINLPDGRPQETALCYSTAEVQQRETGESMQYKLWKMGEGEIDWWTRTGSGGRGGHKFELTNDIPSLLAGWSFLRGLRRKHKQMAGPWEQGRGGSNVGGGYKVQSSSLRLDLFAKSQALPWDPEYYSSIYTSERAEHWPMEGGCIGRERSLTQSQIGQLSPVFQGNAGISKG
ncbi:hypothetical protein DFH06DRAFT_1151370 [Mycena polygramma]|nr:hypothetical protein DFH06DRAFT_1151366 [Mycena polygramma]KAJ7604189.1 hypothetical protein DFH06DRAFT_1151370 [Mycena polygramma]